VRAVAEVVDILQIPVFLRRQTNPALAVAAAMAMAMAMMNFISKSLVVRHGIMQLSG
jgi:3-deoxy-D-manno-octulosonic acid (KDO) 8-phosphate synthase